MLKSFTRRTSKGDNEMMRLVFLKIPHLMSAKNLCTVFFLLQLSVDFWFLCTIGITFINDLFHIQLV